MNDKVTGNPVVQLAQKAYELLVKIGDFCQNFFLLFFRVFFGIQLMKNGWGKLNHHADIVEFFTSLGIPMPDLNAWVAASVECFGSALMIIGFATRPIGALITFTMIVAYMSVTEDRTKVFDLLSLKDLDSFFKADPFFYLLTGVMVFCFGPGKFSADYLLGRFLFKKDEQK
ncbi:MAG: DoxX family protein [Candidatus Melainabacteria bacterium]|nr:DoxX family protein [Candidatus Melainabacteria bacterium]